MDDHFVVGELVFFREDDAAVRGQEPAELRRIKDVDPLEIAGPTVELPLYPDTGLNVGGVKLAKPIVHFLQGASSFRSNQYVQFRDVFAGRALHRAALGLGKFDVVDDLGGDDLPRR